MARSDKLPREANLPRNVHEPLTWLRQLTGRLNVLWAMLVDSVNLLVDGYALDVGAPPEASEVNRSRVVVVRGASGARDRLVWVRKNEDGAHQVVDISPFLDVLVAYGSVDISNVPAGGAASTTIGVTGAQPGDVALASLSTTGAVNILTSAHVEAANTVRVVFYNASGADWDPAAGTLTVVVLRR